MATSNRQIVLVSRRVTVADVSSFELRETDIQEPAPGEVLIQVEYLSIDPWLRVLMTHGSLPIDTVVPGDVVGRVVRSRHALFRAGDIVEGFLGWQQYAVAPWYLLRKIDPSVAPISNALGILGLSGLTAYVGLFHVGRLRPGETIVISAAAGAVGSTAVQLSSLAGCRVIGIVGSDEKVRFLTSELGVAAAVNYNAGVHVRRNISMHAPFGVDVYFDSVGGRVSDAVLPALKTSARVVVCGQISSYDKTTPTSRTSWLSAVLQRRLRIQGFLVSDFAARFPEALCALTACWRAGLLKSRETIAEGLEQAPEAFISLLRGGNIGKQLVRVTK
jgi:NADPH-dependent curcumin reductase CurA